MSEQKTLLRITGYILTLRTPTDWNKQFLDWIETRKESWIGTVEHEKRPRTGVIKVRNV